MALECVISGTLSLLCLPKPKPQSLRAGCVHMSSAVFICLVLVGEGLGRRGDAFLFPAKGWPTRGID